jgi:hypothetical protein
MRSPKSSSCRPIRCRSEDLHDQVGVIKCGTCRVRGNITSLSSSVGMHFLDLVKNTFTTTEDTEITEGKGEGRAFSDLKVDKRSEGTDVLLQNLLHAPIQGLTATRGLLKTTQEWSNGLPSDRARVITTITGLPGGEGEPLVFDRQQGLHDVCMRVQKDTSLLRSRIGLLIAALTIGVSAFMMPSEFLVSRHPRFFRNSRRGDSCDRLF